MKLRLAACLVLLLRSASTYGQERSIDLSEIYEVVDTWAEAHNEKNMSAFDTLYGAEVTFYAKQIPKANCLRIKSEQLTPAKPFHLNIIRKPVVVVYDSEIIRASFVIQVTSGKTVRDYESYLLLKRIDGNLRIIGESDFATDNKAGFVLDIGEVLKTSLLSERTAEIDENALDKVSVIKWTLIGVVIFVGIIIVVWSQRKTYVRNRAQTLTRLQEFYQSRRERIEKAVIEFETLLDANSGYFASSQWKSWESKNQSLFRDLKGRSFAKLRLPNDEVRLMTAFETYSMKGEKFRSEFNRKFLGEELARYRTFFDNIEGRKLDSQQRQAIVTDEDNNLVIAGAGSGKTSTIVGKVRYIIDRYKVAPHEILLISFTNKSAASLASRTGIGRFEAKTFHKFGKDIIAQCEQKEPSLFDENQFKPLLKRFFNELIKDKDYLAKVTEYFVDFLKPDKPQSEFATQGDYIQYIKDQNFRTYKLVETPTRSRKTFKMEVVKSIEECRIANFLLFNGVEYEYELPYEFDTSSESFRQYRPDFTITQNGKKIYLEHFGIDRDGAVPPFFARDGETREQAKAKYHEGIRWKRDLHKTKFTTLIESYSYEWWEGTLFDNLRTKLSGVGITLSPKSPEEIWRILLQAASDEVDSLITLFGTFITLMKSNNYSIQELRQKNQRPQEEFFRKRNNLFIDLVSPLYERYALHLSQRREIDFSDMINQAISYVRDGKYQRTYRYIIIDEFQDISVGRYELVKATKNRSPGCKLFCVGDDWQSIYRFSGSDITLFKDFDRYFGYSERSKIETTYRFNDPLLKISSEFIQRNPNQTRKDLKGAVAVKKTTYKIHYSDPETQDDTQTVRSVLHQLLATDPNIETKEIYLLGRYSFDIDRLSNDGNGFMVDKSTESISYSARGRSGLVKVLKAQFMTVHRSKGLEADVVIVLNCNSGKLGFPSEMSDDPVLNLLLSEGDQYPHGEERRLFYVAMSRARESVHFVADHLFKSTFISELEMRTNQSPHPKCPDCKRGDVIIKKAGVAKNGKRYNFYGCTNYEYGCEYSRMEWLDR